MRYFMSIKEASQLVMQAGMMGSGGEIFVLDMGEPVRIIDLAKDMIKLSGFSDDEIKIEFSGLRYGEKLYEELLADDEITLPTIHKKLRIASAKAVDDKWLQSLIKWIDTIPVKNERLIKEELKSWVKDYQGDINAS
jgi:FlaA1/EpsC-like NDP-sugar epimerase